MLMQLNCCRYLRALLMCNIFWMRNRCGVFFLTSFVLPIMWFLVGGGTLVVSHVLDGDEEERIGFTDGVHWKYRVERVHGTEVVGQGRRSTLIDSGSGTSVLSPSRLLVSGASSSTSWIWCFYLLLPLVAGAFWYEPKRQPIPWWERQWRRMRRRIHMGRQYIRSFLKNWISSKGNDHEAELQRINQKLQMALEERSTLLASAVHDLKNPLLGIRRLSRIVLEDEELSDDARHKIELIRASAIESMDQVDELITSAAQMSETEIEFAPIDVGALAERIVESFQLHAERKDQNLRYFPRAKACVIEGNELKLREAMGNLVSNALKYSPRGETVQVSVTKSRDTIRFSVSDDGPGLSDSDLRILFTPFQQLTPKPTGDERSSGLGLYITKRIADLHGGEIEVDASEGEGSTFALVFQAMSSSRTVDQGNEGLSVPQTEPAS